MAEQSGSTRVDAPEVLPCSVCGVSTIYSCSDCRIETGKSVHVCIKWSCRDAHELNVHKDKQSQVDHTPPKHFPAPTDYSYQTLIDLIEENIKLKEQLAIANEFGRTNDYQKQGTT